MCSKSDSLCRFHMCATHVELFETQRRNKLGLIAVRMRKKYLGQTDLVRSCMMKLNIFILNKEL